MVVTQNDVGGDQVWAFRATGLRPVAKGAVLLEKGGAAGPRRLIRFWPETEKDAGCRGPLFRRSVETSVSGRRLVRPRRVAGGSVLLRFLGHCDRRKKRQAS